MLSLKQIGTICFVFSLILISTKSYSDIAVNNSNPSCDNSTLNTYTGPAALEAKWNANTIQLKWYKDDELLTVQTAANQCTYDGTMTLPSTHPTKIGYDFNGWKVKTASSGGSSSGGLMCGLTDEIISAEPSHYWAKGDNNGTAACFYDSDSEVSCSSDLEFSSLSQHAWKVQTNTGVYEGIASCNDIDNVSVLEALAVEVTGLMEAGTITTMEEASAYIYGNAAMKRNSNTFSSGGDGQYCWCKATAYTPNNGQQCSTSTSSWVFNSATDFPSTCSRYCARICSESFSSYSGFRASLFSN